MAPSGGVCPKLQPEDLNCGAVGTVSFCAVALIMFFSSLSSNMGLLLHVIMRPREP